MQIVLICPDTEHLFYFSHDFFQLKKNPLFAWIDATKSKPENLFKINSIKMPIYNPTLSPQWHLSSTYIIWPTFIDLLRMQRMKVTPIIRCLQLSLLIGPLTYSWRTPWLVSMAGDWHHIRPIIRLHGHTGSMSAGHVKGGGTAAAWALDTSACLPLPRATLTTIDAPL